MAVFLLLQIHVASANYEQLYNLFHGHGGGHHQQQQQQQQQQHHHQQQRTGASQFSAYADSVACAHYLCPRTLDCVELPSNCPCPNVEDIKCLIPDMDGDVDDATVVCVRGNQECKEVERLMKKYSQ
ncbi:hypothetical protein AGABI2DRAFT_67235 [Agaricus bisporus var. bisporus H97]|uniref:hypothetical protein n=1 Tax=Agaricus bisporus var. bisporus (strain H97 / ATCC MYA-4626 / FGSC 10389) TaxID=936046 RepID=UPI00029F601B|nr:hypothetical protein AGABI2DRAFT_67235 [Agaricus bisporus var. bisporus H97]EKV48503.1 hypothetical protein AGABI2DRAFT_67235 [Agaricus bisporus var. bisporus H97]